MTTKESSNEAPERALTLISGGAAQPVSPSHEVPLPDAAAPDGLPPVPGVTEYDAPLRRFKAQDAGLPLWSATAGWTDLTEHEPVDLPTGLPDRWTSRWSLTFRHGRNDLVSTVANMSEADLLEADPIRVNSWHKNKTARAGLRYINATGRLHAHESLFERKLLGLLDFHGVTNVVSQPFTLTYYDGDRERNHTPDFLIEADGQLVVINTRPRHLVKDRLLTDAAAVAALATSRGWGNRLVVGYRLPGQTIVETVRAHARADDDHGYGEAIVEFLAHHGPAPFDAVCSRFESPVIARAAMQRLIWERQVSIDLATQLEDSTLVALPGEEEVRL